MKWAGTGIGVLGHDMDASETRTRRTAPRQDWPSGFVRASSEFVSRGCTGYAWPPILKVIFISALQGISHIWPRPSTDSSDAPGTPEYIALDTSLYKKSNVLLVNEEQRRRRAETRRREGGHLYYALRNLRKRKPRIEHRRQLIPILSALDTTLNLNRLSIGSNDPVLVEKHLPMLVHSIRRW